VHSKFIHGVQFTDIERNGRAHNSALNSTRVTNPSHIDPFSVLQIKHYAYTKSEDWEEKITQEREGKLTTTN
jgi:hypothetical protein